MNTANRKRKICERFKVDNEKQPSVVFFFIRLCFSTYGEKSRVNKPVRFNNRRYILYIKTYLIVLLTVLL